MNGSGLVRVRHGNERIVYVNMGGTYSTTLYFDFHTSAIVIGSWGGWHEAVS